MYTKKNKNYKQKINRKILRFKILQHIKAIKFLLKSNKLLVSTKNERHEENIRKAFHLCGIILPYMILYFTQKNAIILLLTILTPTLIIDYNSFALNFKKFTYSNVILQLFREHELIKGKLSGFSWILIGILLIIITFDKQLAALSVAVLIISDAFAALIGKNFGRIKLCGSKTLEGTIAFIISGLLTSLVFVKYVLQSQFIIESTGIIPINFNQIYICISILFSSIVELVAKNIEINDNFAVPVSFCLMYKILMIL